MVASGRTARPQSRTRKEPESDRQQREGVCRIVQQGRILNSSFFAPCGQEKGGASSALVQLSLSLEFTARAIAVKGMLFLGLRFW